MKFYKLILIILVIFSRTGNVLSDTNIFDVNNIEVEKKGKISNELLANQAIKKGFEKLKNNILIEEDSAKLEVLKFSEIKELVSYYQISEKKDNDMNLEKVNFYISFDKTKVHDLFYRQRISYSDIKNKELFILPILKKNDQILIYNKNFFYNEWNKFFENKLIEFILPLENIEIIQSININKENILNLELKNLFKEYSGKNLALVLIEDKSLKEEKIYIKSKILEKNFLKKIEVKRTNLNDNEFYEKIIIETKKEITNLMKLQNLIDIRAPSFLNAKFKISKNNNLVELNSRIKKIDSIEKIFIKEFNNKSVFIRIKYLGKMDKIINQLENQKVILKLIDDEWRIKII